MTAVRKAFEVHLCSEEEVRRYVSLAAEIVDDENVPEDLREAAYLKAVDLLAQKHVQFEQVSPAGVLMRPNGLG